MNFTTLSSVDTADSAVQITTQLTTNPNNLSMNINLLLLVTTGWLDRVRLQVAATTSKKLSSNQNFQPEIRPATGQPRDKYNPFLE
jgi:hypothetical protein